VCALALAGKFEFPIVQLSNKNFSVYFLDEKIKEIQI
jgi:hypothetical protein